MRKNNFNTKIFQFILISISLIFLTNFISATQTCQVYDNFSSGSIDTSKWTESTFNNRAFTDIHLVQNGVYHVAQNIIDLNGRETNLIPTRQFVAGDSLSYDVIYNGGSGNHQSQPLINGNYPPSQIETCNFTTAGCGPIGFWNAFPDLGAQIGTYKIKFDFFSNQVKMTAIRPDNVTVINTFTGNSAPFTLAINTHTGHNGLMNFDFDNFITCSEQITPPAPTLEQRVNELENKTVALELRVNQLENRTSSLELIVSNLQISFNDFVKKINNFISKLPKGLGGNREDSKKDK